jgi:hypothetical protein
MDGWWMDQGTKYRMEKRVYETVIPSCVSRKETVNHDIDIVIMEGNSSYLILVPDNMNIAAVEHHNCVMYGAGILYRDTPLKRDQTIR